MLTAYVLVFLVLPSTLHRLAIMFNDLPISVLNFLFKKPKYTQLRLCFI